MLYRNAIYLALSLLSALFGSAVVHAESSLLNVSYDVSRELYKEINPAFAVWWEKQGNPPVTINQSHGGSSKQALSVAAGLEADVVTMNQPPDIDVLARSGLVVNNWREQFPHNASPYTTTSVFLVRKGNPKGIRDWEDLIQPGLKVIVPNPKTSGNGRYTYVAAWGYALDKTGTEKGAEDFVRALFKNVPVFDGGGRGATTTFTQRGIGDVLVTFENEAILIERELGEGQFVVIYPSISIDAAAPIAIINKITQKRGSTALAKSYLNFLYSKEGQTIIAKHHFRPRDPEVLKANEARFPAIKTFSVEEKLQGWDEVREKHFVDGALFDQIVVNH